MKVSILTPTTGRPTLLKVIESIESQTYKEWEHIVAPNSLKQSPVKRYSSKRHYTDDLGLCNDFGARARREAFTVSSGELICWLDDDDWWEPEFLETMVSFMKENEAIDFSYCGTTLHDRNTLEPLVEWGREFDGDLLPKSNYILTPSYCHRRKLLEGYMPYGGYNSDWNFLIDSHKAGYRFQYVPKNLAHLCVDPGVWSYWGGEPRVLNNSGDKT